MKKKLTKLNSFTELKEHLEKEPIITFYVDNKPVLVKDFKSVRVRNFNDETIELTTDDDFSEFEQQI